MKTLCVFHANCDDGFAAAWVVRNFLGADNVEFYPGVYQQEPPDVTGRDVIMVDFSYKRPVLEAMLQACRNFTLLDHHKSAKEDLAGLVSNPSAGSIVFDMERSGAGLAWDYFSMDDEDSGSTRPEFINYIEDRDLWRKALPGGDEFTIALRSYPQDFAVWDELVRRGPESLIAEGASIQRYYRLRVDELKRSSYPATLAGHEILVSNAPYFAASEVAGELAEGRPFGASYFEVRAGQWQYSLRSRTDGVDVSEIAKQFGGGGHCGAAGFTVAEPVHIR